MPTMHAKTLNHFAKALAHRFAGWRSDEDLEILSGFPDGVIDIDILTGSATHASGGALNLQSVRELQSWLAGECNKKGLRNEDLEEARLTVSIDTTKVKTDRTRIVHFDFGIDCLIGAFGESYAAHQEENHIWHTRSGYG